jgi:hypothetical protein
MRLCHVLLRQPYLRRTIANASMWTQGLGVVETQTRTLRGKDVLVVVMNESAAEFDLEPSAFDLERGKAAIVDVTVRLVNFLSLIHFVTFES